MRNKKLMSFILVELHGLKFKPGLVQNYSLWIRAFAIGYMANTSGNMGLRFHLLGYEKHDLTTKTNRWLNAKEM